MRNKDKRSRKFLRNSCKEIVWRKSINHGGKTQAEVNAGVFERALKAKPNLKVCTNHTKAVQPTVAYTVEQLRELKANRVTGTKRFKTAI